MAADFQHAKKGDRKLDLRSYNAMMDVARQWLQASRRGLNQANVFFEPRSGTIVNVRNDSGTDLDTGQVLGIDASLFDPDDQRDAFLFDGPSVVGATPADGVHNGRFVVLAQPIKNDDVGLAYAAGVCPAKVSLTNSDDGFADINDGTTSNLLSDASAGAAQILWSPGLSGGSSGATGEQWCIIRFGAGGSSLSKGQYQYQVFQMVAQNATGWDWVRAHPDI